MMAPIYENQFAFPHTTYDTEHDVLHIKWGLLPAVDEFNVTSGISEHFDCTDTLCGITIRDVTRRTPKGDGR